MKQLSYFLSAHRKITDTLFCFVQLAVISRNVKFLIFNNVIAKEADVLIVKGHQRNAIPVFR